MVFFVFHIQILFPANAYFSFVHMNGEYHLKAKYFRRPPVFSKNIKKILKSVRLYIHIYVTYITIECYLERCVRSKEGYPAPLRTGSPAPRPIGGFRIHSFNEHLDSEMLDVLSIEGQLIKQLIKMHKVFFTLCTNVFIEKANKTKKYSTVRYCTL